jgi:polysaccharide pyruvyl transferase WcaK-like protein
MKIHVLGWYDTPTSVTKKGNTGDESYKLSFPKLFPEHEFIFCDTLKDIEPETVILGGGDVLYPSFLNQIKASKANRKYAFSINIKDETDYLHIFDRVISRNIYKHIEYYPDFAFALEANKERGKAIIRNLFNHHKCELYEKVVILVMNNYLVPKENTLSRDQINFEKVCLDLARIMDSTSASFILLPFGNGFPTNDKIANASVYSKCKYWSKNLLVFESLGVQDTLDMFAGADASINTRLHSNIFSCIAGTPFIDLCHHTKTKLFMSSIGKEAWSIDYWHFNFETVKTLLNEFLSKKDFYREEISKIDEMNKKLLTELSI